MVLKRFNDLVDELAVWLGVPFELVACVAVEQSHSNIGGLWVLLVVLLLLLFLLWLFGAFFGGFRLESWVIGDGVVVFMERVIM